jgi:hypothetical protein
MADFCNKCAPEMWGKDAPPDIDVYQIAEGLEFGHFASVLCEGCRVRAVGKDNGGKILVALLEEEGHVEDQVKWVSLEEWESIEG